MSYAIHYFKLARLNSEMKYVLHSISRDTPAYAYPAIRCMKTWQRDLKDRLDQWAAEIPHKDVRKDYIVKVCLIRCHVLKSLLLRPSPGIPNPGPDDLKECYNSAVSAVKLYHELYIECLLVFSWGSYHSIMMSSVTSFFCIWTCPDIVQDIAIDALVSDLRAASNLLSAIGEHWSGAKRSRDILDELARRTINFVMDRKMRGDNRPSTNLSNSTSIPGSTTNTIAFDLGLGPTSMSQSHSEEHDALMQQYSRSWMTGLDFLPTAFDQNDTSMGLWTGDMNTDTFLQDILDGLAPMANDAQNDTQSFL